MDGVPRKRREADGFDRGGIPEDGSGERAK